MMGAMEEPRHELPLPPERIDLDEGAFLRLYVPGDAELIFKTVDRQRERLRHWLPWVDTTKSPADTRAFIEATIATEGREFAYGIFAADGLAGGIGLHADRENRSAMIGYWIDGEHEGQGLITRSSRALTDIAFRDLGMHRVWLSADAKNTRSRAVAERLGFHLEGIHRGDSLRGDRFRDTVIYAILEDEWRTTEPG
jgi:ribosomal-protein-serine acetyltransferase